MKIPDEIWKRMEEEAEARHNLHKGQASSRPLHQSRTKRAFDYELVGLTGEWCFSIEFDLPMDWKRRIAGDGRVDFYCGQHSIDVKTGRGNAFNLLRETNKKHASILVLAECDFEKREVVLFGWEFNEEMLKCPIRRFHSKGPLNHFKHNTNLNSIDQLRQYLGFEFYAEMDESFYATSS